MSKSYRADKSFGPKKHKPGGNYNPRREERQKLRRGKERELEDTINKYKEDPDSYTEFEQYLRFREDKPNGKT